MNNPCRVFWFRHYWWIVIALCAAISLVSASAFKPDTAIELAKLLIGASLGVVYFVQKQKLDETLLFERLFTKFNDRYDLISGELQSITAENATEGSIVNTTKVDNTLNSYFNLCAEEYLLFTEGRILRPVWRSWCRGMEEYLKRPRIQQFFEREVGQDSHYGLTRDVISKGAL